MKEYVYCHHQSKEADSIKSSASFLERHRNGWIECIENCSNCGCQIIPNTFLLIFEFWRDWALGPLIALTGYLARYNQLYIHLLVILAISLYQLVPILIVRYGRWQIFYKKIIERRIIKWHLEAKRKKWIIYVQNLLIGLAFIYKWVAS